MKTALKIYWLVLILFSFTGSIQANTLAKSTVYVVEKLNSNTLAVRVRRSDKNLKSELILRGRAMGIPKQVQNLICDGKPIKEKKPGIWELPRGCQNLQWQILLNENKAQLASAQQSLIVGDFILFSEASSLPRLKEESAEFIKLLIPNIKNTVPKTNEHNEIRLANRNSAPFFLLLNPTIVKTISSDSMQLSYLLDNSDAASKLPNMASHWIALNWLKTIIPSRAKEKFTIAWLGLRTKNPSLAGAAGSDILLANYPLEGEFPFGEAMLLYVALHEAVHQLSANYSAQPIWVSESLASYYGLRALYLSTPNDQNVSKLREKFLASADHFKDGLVKINRKVQEGNQSEYGAFYTKGLAFWTAVDETLNQTQNKTLDNYLLALLQAKYDADGEPRDLQKVLNLSPETWSTLYQRYLN